MGLIRKINYPIFDWENSNQKSIDVDFIIAEKNAGYIVHRALVTQQASQRQGTASTKTRSEVKGGGKKPWKQKGTGKARAGSNRSPLWRGGGVIFGPKSDINYNKKINKKELQLALRTLLYNKSDKTVLVENFDTQFDQPSTKKVMCALKNWGLDLGNKILIIVAKKNYNLYLSTRNIPNVDIIAANNLNVIDLLKNKFLLITTDALDKINEVYNA